MPNEPTLQITLPATLARKLRSEASRTGEAPTETAAALIDEALRLRQCPGIAFTDGPAGRRATIAGTGIDVWEVIRADAECHGSLPRLRRAFPHLTPAQINAARTYYRLYPQEIDARLSGEKRAERQLRRRAPAAARPRATR